MHRRRGNRVGVHGARIRVYLHGTRDDGFGVGVLMEAFDGLIGDGGFAAAAFDGGGGAFDLLGEHVAVFDVVQLLVVGRQQVRVVGTLLALPAGPERAAADGAFPAFGPAFGRSRLRLGFHVVPVEAR